MIVGERAMRTILAQLKQALTSIDPPIHKRSHPGERRLSLPCTPGPPPLAPLAWQFYSSFPNPSSSSRVFLLLRLMLPHPSAPPAPGCGLDAGGCADMGQDREPRGEAAHGIEEFLLHRVSEWRGAG